MTNYDRRGRGDSGDTAPYSVDREIEDLLVVIEAAGGSGALFGNSGGAFLAIRAVAGGIPGDQIAAWEPPHILPESRPPVPVDYADQQTALAEKDDRGAMAELFPVTAVSMPAEVVAGLRQGSYWGYLGTAASPALVYDTQLSADFAIDKQQSRVTCPVLMVDGATTPWISQAADAVAATTPRRGPPHAARAAGQRRGRRPGTRPSPLLHQLMWIGRRKGADECPDHRPAAPLRSTTHSATSPEGAVSAPAWQGPGRTGCCCRPAAQHQPAVLPRRRTTPTRRRRARHHHAVGPPRQPDTEVSL